MIRHLIISGVEMDIADVEIVRTYHTPFFTDVEELRNDHTYTVNLPITPKNMAVFGYANREDMYTTKPYDYLYADYYVNGLAIFRNAECRLLGVSDTFEVEFVYGINRNSIVGLFEKQLNQISEDDLQVEYADWIFEWRKSNVVYTPSTINYYNFIEYVSGIRTSDVETISGVVQPKLQPDEPALSNLKQMTAHPFVLSTTILDLIDRLYNTSVSSLLSARLQNKGLILSGKKDNFDYEYSFTYDGSADTSQDMHISESGGNDFIISFTRYKFKLLNFLLIDDYDVKLVLDVTILSLYEIELWETNLTDNTSEKVSDIPYASRGDFDIVYDCTIDLTMQQGYEYYFKFAHSVPINNDVSGTFKIQKNIKESIYSMQDSIGYGRYNLIENMPELKPIEFIQQMLIHTGLFLGYDSVGALKAYSLDNVKTNLANGVFYNWSGRISNVRNGIFEFNNNAQKNHIKFNNDSDLTTDRKETLVVNDNTIDFEKDLYNLSFDSPLGAYNEKSEFILYEQTVKRSGDTGVSFENKYVGDKFSNGFVLNDTGVAKNIKVIEPTYYSVYKKLIERPIVKEVEINLGFFESANIDFEKPIYIQEWGKYAVLLELTAPDNDVCTAKLLLINQTL